MAIEQLLNRHRKGRFQAFDICLADGRSFPVIEPEFLGICPTGRTIVIGLDDGTQEIVDLRLVTNLKPRPE